MKHNYILENYDRIVKEIKNPKIIFSNDLTPFLRECTVESFLIHQIEFRYKNDEIKFNAKKPIHNLHPKFDKITFKADKITSEFEQNIPSILSKLNIVSDQSSWHWCAKKDNTLYILQKFEIENLTQENRFFLYCYHTLKMENDKIKKTDKEHIFKLNSKEKIEQYIHQKQYALENLAQRLIKDINPDNPAMLYQFSNNYDRNDCLKITYVFIVKLHRFVEKEYKNYLNVNSHIANSSYIDHPIPI